MDRILFNGEKATVKYRGRLQHKVDNAKIKADEDWLGVEWDKKDKGKHDGTVDGFQYFEASGPKAGSLVLAKKAEFGQEIVEALVRRYFRDHEVNEILKHKEDIVDYLKGKWEKQAEKLSQQHLAQPGPEDKPKPAKAPEAPVEATESKVQDTEKMEEKPIKPKEKKERDMDDSDDDMFEDDDTEQASMITTQKASRGDALEKLMNKIKDKDCYTEKQATVEYDEDAIIKTFKNRFKRIEFKGFDKVWERIYNMDRIIELCLSSQKISNFGSLGGVGKIVSNLKNLTLENNLLHNWSQILVLGTELPKLESLSVSYNFLEMDPAGYDSLELQTYNTNQEVKKVADKSEIFPKLGKLIAIDTGLTLNKLNKVVKFMGGLSELILCKNQCNDFSCMLPEHYSNIVSLNLEDNSIDDLCSFQLLSQLPKLRDLALNHNRINRFADTEKFEALQNVNLSHNAIVDGKIITDMSRCPQLKSLKINYNPIEEGVNKKDISRRAVAEISTLTRVNGMDLNRYERKDCEYYFLRWVFHEYFKLHNLHQLSYKYADFCVWAEDSYPAVFKLIEKYENPYPEVEIQNDKGDMKEQMQRADQSQANRYTKIIFSSIVGPLSGKPPIAKVFPRSTDFLYIRNWVSQTYKIKNKEAIAMKFKNGHSQVYEEIDDMAKTIEFYDIKDNADLLIEDK